jgi:hypothetical protein
MRAAAGGTCVAREIDLGGPTFARERIAPVTAQDAGESLEIVLLDQEVRLGTSTLASAGWAADERGDVLGEAAIAQRLHLGDRAGHRGDQREAAQHLFGVVVRHGWRPKNGMAPGRGKARK